MRMTMRQEPFRLTRWKPKEGQVTGQLWTCARPGRSIGAKVGNIPDILVDAWVKGLPSSGALVIVSLLGRKPNGKSEFSFYTFRGSSEQSERPDCLSFQEWLDRNYGIGRYCVIEYPTTDLEAIAPESLREISVTVLSRLGEGQVVILMDSGGIGRVGRVCHHVRFEPE